MKKENVFEVGGESEFGGDFHSTMKFRRQFDPNQYMDTNRPLGEIQNQTQIEGDQFENDFQEREKNNKIRGMQDDFDNGKDDFKIKEEEKIQEKP